MREMSQAEINATLFDEVAHLRAKLEEADKIIKPLADLARFYGSSNMREAAITRTRRDFSKEDAPVETKCLEIRTIFEAAQYIRERNNG